MFVGIAGLIALGALAVPFVRLGLAANRAGLLSTAEPEKYSASRAGNLKAIATALQLSYESDGQFPEASKWMDTLFTRMKTDNLSEEQAKEKLQRPGVASGAFGYAMNTAASGKLKRELPPGTVIIFESVPTGWNASGPLDKALKGAWGVTLDGETVELPSGKAPDGSKPAPVR